MVQESRLNWGLDVHHGGVFIIKVWEDYNFLPFSLHKKKKGFCVGISCKALYKLLWKKCRERVKSQVAIMLEMDGTWPFFDLTKFEMLYGVTLLHDWFGQERLFSIFLGALYVQLEELLLFFQTKGFKIAKYPLSIW
jgi:hypothetical protein